MIYCLEYLEKNIDWLLEQLDKIQGKNISLIIIIIIIIKINYIYIYIYMYV